MKVDYKDYIEEAIDLYEKQENKSVRDVGRILHKKYNIQIKLNSFIRNLSKKLKPGNKKKKNIQYEDIDKAKPFVLSAWNDKTGLMMDMDEYCTHYKLPRSDVKSYKLVSHTGTPYYNILFKENIEINEIIDYSFVDEIVKNISNQ